MYGQNPQRKQDRETTDGTVAVQEIFYTIQGEGPFSGQPAVFVRLAGCHLACTFCDTEFESGINNRLTPEEVVQSVRLAAVTAEVKPTLVVLTGGEPLRQICGPMVTALLTDTELGIKTVQVETSGSLWDQTLAGFVAARRVVLVASPKTSYVHPMVMRFTEHWKYVIRASDNRSALDGLPMSGTQPHHSKTGQAKIARPWDLQLTRPVTVWVSPCDEKDAELNAANQLTAVSLSLRYGYRLSLQVHKIINLP